MSLLSHRDRVLQILNHREADRVPRDLMGNATMILDDAYFRLRDYLGLAPIEPVRKGASANYYDERLLDYFDIDFRRIFLEANDAYNIITEDADGTYTDIWTMRYRKKGIYVTAVSHPLADAEDLRDVEAFAWPRAAEMFQTKGLKERAREKFFSAPQALVARNPFSAGFIDRACQLMGTENFCLSLVLRPQVVQSVLWNIFKIYNRAYALFLEEVGDFVQMVETADDIGTQNSLLISPEHYRRFIKPLERDLYRLIHEKAPGAAVFRHTDGSVFSLIPDFVEVGIDVLNPVQTSAQGMDGAGLKSAYGDKITFHGAIESAGAPEDVIENDVREKMRTFKRNGGYIFAPCNHIVDAQPKSIIRLFEAAERYGGY
jgi:uroporphyrinogen decarboxylase